MNYFKKIFVLFILLYCNSIDAQFNKKDTLRSDFTYSLKAKLSTRSDIKYEELFSLQIGDKRAFFASTQSLKRDSVMKNAGTTTTQGNVTVLSLKGVQMPKTNYYYTIIQSNENVQYFELVGMSLLTYKEPIISNWKLINETKIVNTLNCKKAEVLYKGRNWIAWYSTEIPFPYGPYKFSGLPGLIVKITDEKGDYDFELLRSINSTKLTNKLIDIKKSRYNDAIETTQIKLKQAVKNNNENVGAFLSSYDTTIVKGQDLIKQREKEREENRKFENPLEILDSK